MKLKEFYSKESNMRLLKLYIEKSGC